MVRAKKAAPLPAAKEAGWIITIDQASNAAGVTLWLDGEFMAATTLNSTKSTDPFGRRLATQAAELERWLISMGLGPTSIKMAIFEGVRARIVLCTVGAFCAVPQLQGCRLHARHTFVESISWKRWAQRRGAEGPMKDIKGVQALMEIGWDFAKYPIATDDEADSVMIYQTWKER